MTILHEVDLERQKQREKWGDEHDDMAHTIGELLDAAVATLLMASPRNAESIDFANLTWPWPGEMKTRTQRDAMIVGMAFVYAEIQRLDRLHGEGKW